MQTTDFTDFEPVGRGGFGTVFSAFCKPLHRQVAIKKLIRPRDPLLEIRDPLLGIDEELNILKLADHQNIVLYLDAIDVPRESETWIITEYVNGGSLRPYCTGNKNLSITEKLALSKQCWLALAYLHSINVIHKNIKPENILLKVNDTGPLSYTAKLCDFGLEKVSLGEPYENLPELLIVRSGSTTPFLPPEIFVRRGTMLDIRQLQQADVYSLGVTCCEFLTCMHFWRRSDGAILKYSQIVLELEKIANDPSADTPNTACLRSLQSLQDVPSNIRGILRHTVFINPDNRPAAADVLDVFSDNAARFRFYGNYSFTNSQHLGSGGQGSVYSAFCKPLYRQVAIKKIPCDDATREKIKTEIRVLREVQHPNIVVILDAFDVSDEFDATDKFQKWILTEYVNGGHLNPYCTGDKKDQLNINEKLEISQQCWSALNYLHSKNITHKDLKPENILLQINQTQPFSYTAKICDFGLAKILETLAVTRQTTLTGTSPYWPPEMMLGETDDSGLRNPQQGDVYSLGVTCCEFLTSMHFWSAPDGTCLIKPQIYGRLAMIAHNPSSEIPTLPCAKLLLELPGVDTSIKNMLSRTILLKDRHNRPTAAQVLNAFVEGTTNNTSSTV